MTPSTQKLPGEPIIVHTQRGATEDEIRGEMLGVIQLLDEQSGPVFFILDLTDSPIARSLDAVVVASNLAARQLKLFKHPNIHQILFVTTNQA